MPDIIQKPKPWSAEVYELQVGQKKHFPKDSYGYVKSMVSGLVKEKFPERGFTIKQEENEDPEQESVSVERLN